jgi:phage recombination protein Bet
MSNELAKAQNQLPDFTPEQMRLITDTIARGATPNELQLFLYRCKALALDPLKPGQIHFVKYGNNPGTVIVGIEGFRAKAARTGRHVGTKRGVIRDDKGVALGGWAEVFRSDWKEPARAEVSLAEYSTGSGPWKKMPESMIQKVAEAASLRMAFPDDLGGVYIEEEEAIIARDAGRVAPEQPMPGDGIMTDEYCCSNNLAKAFPALVKKPISKCDPLILKSAVEAIEKKAKDGGKVIPAWAAEFITHAEPIIAAWENAQPQNPDALDLKPGGEE